MNERRTIQIWHENLAVLRVNQRLPLSKLENAVEIDDELHIHGGLRIRIGERLVPYLGYFGPDDVCFNDWVVELGSVARAFESAQGRHVFDEGEQGQPAFVFERDEEEAFLTIAPSELSGADGDPSWQRVGFSPAEFLVEHARFRESLFSAIREAAPVAAEAWIRKGGSGDPPSAPMEV